MFLFFLEKKTEFPRISIGWVAYAENFVYNFRGIGGHHQRHVTAYQMNGVEWRRKFKIVRNAGAGYSQFPGITQHHSK